MAKSGLEKELAKQIKENQKIAKDRERQTRAQSIVEGAMIVSGFRVMDSDSEALLKEILNQYDGNENNHVEFNVAQLPRPLREFAPVGYKTLKLYGVLIETLSVWGNGALITLSENAKEYFQRKQMTLDKAKDEKPQGTVNIQGDGNCVQLQSNTVNSTQQIQSTEYDIDFGAVENILNQIFSYQSLFEKEFGERCAELEQALIDAKDAVGNRELGRTRKAVGTIKAILENATGSLIATGALAALAQLPNLFL